MAVALAKDVPSKAAKSANLIKQQKENPIRIGRPHDTCGPPITIYERVFADFRRNMSEGQEDLLSPTDYEAVGTLLVSLSAVYREKKERQAVLTLILGKLLNQSIDVVQLEDGTSNDGICTVHVGGGYSALLLLCEFKNEPCLQASFSFTRWWSQDRVGQVYFLFDRNANKVVRRPSVAIRLFALLFCLPSMDLGCLSMGVPSSVKIGLYNHSRI